jgi:hypothetical protein
MGTEVNADDAEVAAFVCSHIFRATYPVLLVARENGDWMYLCGNVHAESEEYYAIGREHLIDRDSTLAATTDLPDQTEADRVAVGSPWTRRALTPE